MTMLADGDARARIRNDLEATLIVEAAAGTGKTTELVGRILSLLRTGKTTLGKLVAVTFTEKAAGEMKLRLRTEIERARVHADTTTAERACFDHALAELEAAHIGTIHGFCSDLLRERPVEAKIDPLFEVAAEDEKERIYEECFERWFQRELNDPGEGVRRMLRRRSRDRDASGPRSALRGAGAALIEQRDFGTRWRRDPIDRPQRMDAVLLKIEKLGALAERADWKDSWLAKNLGDIDRWFKELTRREEIRPRDYDGLEAELRALSRIKGWEWKGSGRYFCKGLERQTVMDERAAVKAELDSVLEAVDADLAACLHAELKPLVVEYEKLKARAGKLDFLDLLVVTRDLIRDDAVVRKELQVKYTHLLVDEFQDTDPLQAEILLLLAADDPQETDFTVARPVRGKLFVVGDPKQSIYRFRRADVALYEMTKRRLVAFGGEVLNLTTSFRSAPSIQQAVNAAFAPIMQGSADGSQATYVALQPYRKEPNRPTVIALPVPRPYGDYGKIVSWRVDESLPDAVGAFVDFVINKSGWTLTERDRPDIEVPIDARHICLLFKRFQNFGEDVTRGYVRALEARRIPHVLVGGRSYHAREEVMAIRNALTAVEWPDDELSVFATLRGPFFAIADDALLAFRSTQGSLHTLRRCDETTLTELTRQVADALGILGKLHHGRNRRPIADTITQLLEATRAHAGVAIWPTGEQALANILRVLDLARRFESSGATSFRAFVNRLENEADRGGAAEAPVVEEGTDGVRIMTVHRAKGLEFPVVILVDPTAPSTHRDPSRYVDTEKKLWAMPLAGCTPIELKERREEVLRHDREEAHRLAYVAATRARELLVVPVCGDEEISGWVDVLKDVVNPSPPKRRDAAVAPGCPAFGGDSVRERPDNVTRRVEDSVMPGLHRPRAGEHQVVWWDPFALDLDKDHDVGLRQQRILAADESGAVAEEGARLHAEWQVKRSQSIASGSKPSLCVRTVTEAKNDPKLRAAAVGSAVVALESTDASRSGRPHGKRFGVLVHAVLATVPLAGDQAAVEEIARAQARLVGATAEEISAAVSSVLAALRHPLLVRAHTAGRECRRESQVSLKLEDESMLEGVIDLAFREVVGGAPRWTVVDFKTDVEIASRRPEYEGQLTMYARAVSAATGEAAVAVLLSV